MGSNPVSRTIDDKCVEITPEEIKPLILSGAITFTIFWAYYYYHYGFNEETYALAYVSFYGWLFVVICNLAIEKRRNK